jgi:ribosome biogenesis protein Nip4
LRLLKEFLEGVGSRLALDEAELLRINNKRFTAGEELAGLMPNRLGLVYAGRFLGRDKRVFIPSSILLEELSREPGTRKAHVDRRAAWLFVCGRDIFEENLVIEGELGLGDLYLVVFEGGCLGYGRIEEFEGRMILRNLFDVGDFLRRERKPSKRRRGSGPEARKGIRTT